VDCAALGKQALNLLSDNDYDILILDLTLPDMDGLALCRSLRNDPQHGRIPVLMLTARDSLQDKLSGFGAGADDYLVKPFSLLELEARLIALNQRRSLAGQTRNLSFADIHYNLDTVEIKRGSRGLNLSTVPRKILELLMRANGRTVSRPELSQALWGENPPDADALSVHIHSLRSALHKNDELPVLQTVRGEGYRLVNSE
ncbi:MAG: response regulator transcription factor, partial [Nevskiales bacterium]